MNKKKPCETVGTLSHFKKYRWKEINKRTVNGSQRHRLQRPGNAAYLRKQIELRVSKDEFYIFCELNKELILKIYASGDKPSIDRLDSAGHYELSNMQIVPLSENIRRRSY